MLHYNHFNEFVLVHAGYLFVSDALSTPTITEPPSLECQDLLIPHRSRSKVLKTQHLAISWLLFETQTSYLVPIYNAITCL